MWRSYALYLSHQTSDLNTWQNITRGSSRGVIFCHVFKSEFWWRKYNAYELNVIYNITLQHEYFRYSTVTWVSGLIAKYSPGNVRTKDMSNPSFYMSCKVIYKYLVFNQVIIYWYQVSCDNMFVFYWANILLLDR